MSAIPVLKPPVSKPQKRRRHRVTSGPIAQTRVHTRTRTRGRSGSESQTIARAATFAIIVCCAFIASSLFGNVMVEKARREGLRAAERAREARKAETVLREQVDMLVSLTAVEDWATAHSFVAPDGLGQAPAQVTRGTTH